MRFIPETTDLTSYLEATPLVDYKHPLIQETLKNLTTPIDDEVEKAKILFEYVRDQIPHAWDIQSPLVTQKASEVIIEGTGICYAKSNLLAALLRGVSILVVFVINV